MKHPPKLVCALAYGHDAWVVGSAAKEGNTEPRDWDVMVPFSQWQAAAFLIPPDAKPNTFGGYKCLSDGCVVDVWPGELGVVMAWGKATVAWHPKTDTRITREG